MKFLASQDDEDKYLNVVLLYVIRNDDIGLQFLQNQPEVQRETWSKILHLARSQLQLLASVCLLVSWKVTATTYFVIVI